MADHLDKETYLETQEMLVQLARMVQLLPLEKFIATAEYSDTFAPFVDPTLWRKGHRSLSEVLELARGAAHFKSIVEKVLAASEKKR
jgi:hypothetical protein